MENFVNLHYGEIISSLITIISLYILRFAFIKLTNKKVIDPIRRYFFIQTAGYVVLIAAIIILSMIWVEWIRSLVTFLSLIIGALVITGKELILSLFANLVIFWRSLFSVGDRITVADHTGDVTELGAFYITLAEIESSGLYTGRTVKVPNNIITTQVVINHSKSGGLIWNVAEYPLRSLRNMEEVEQIIKEKLKEIHHQLSRSDREILLDNHSDLMFRDSEPRIIIERKEYGILLKIAFITGISESLDRKNMLNSLMIKLAGEGYFEGL